MRMNCNIISHYEVSPFVQKFTMKFHRLSRNCIIRHPDMTFVYHVYTCIYYVNIKSKACKLIIKI